MTPLQVQRQLAATMKSLANNTGYCASVTVINHNNYCCLANQLGNQGI